MAEFSRCILSVLSLSKAKAKIVWLATSLIARKAAFLHKKELSGVVCLSFRPPTEFVIFCPINYRPVSLTSVVVKSLERLIHNHIMSFLSDNRLLCDNQHGFRPLRTCVTQLLQLVPASGLVFLMSVALWMQFL